MVEHPARDREGAGSSPASMAMSSQSGHCASPGYAFALLHQALETAQSHPDAAVRQRAEAKAERWRLVIEGMADGTLRVGSRTPVAQTPAWVTLEVAHGGFATGRYLAEGELRAHEEELLLDLPADSPGTSPRERLNLYFLTDQGQRRLLTLADESRFAIEVPEEGALLVFAWLLRAGQHESAFDLLAELRPLMHRLRFYPRPTASASPPGSMVHVSTVGEVIARFSELRAPAPLLAMRQLYRVWNPLYDRLVSLWAETVEGPVPTMERDDAGRLVRQESGQPIIVGGWPCKHWPAGWIDRRERWLADYRAATKARAITGRHKSDKSTFQILRGILERCPSDSRALTGRDVGRVRHALAGTVGRHGAPGTDQRSGLRAEQTRQATLPLHAELAPILKARLAPLPASDGLDSLDRLSRPVAEGESTTIAADTAIPARLVRKGERALEGSVAELVERGVIGSAEVLAIVLPQITSQVSAAGIEDESLREVFAHTYAAFRRRRSLLLLDLEHQVRLEELPWIAAVEGQRQQRMGAATLAQQTLREVTLLTFTAFPHTITPNPLVRELSTLARQAGHKWPLVEEVAADIFMGTFTKKWAEAAALASEFLVGTLYARYYDLPALRDQPKGLLTKWFKKTSPAFDTLCQKRAREAGEGGGGVARNGAILEQSQILTTHNLAVLASGLALRPELESRGAELAGANFQWVVRRLAEVPAEFIPRLRAIKNAAYAWRQALFFLSFCHPGVQNQVIEQLEQDLATQPHELQSRFRPAVRGLWMILRGGLFDKHGRGADGARRYLGWACGPHWLMPQTSSG